MHGNITDFPPAEGDFLEDDDDGCTRLSIGSNEELVESDFVEVRRVVNSSPASLDLHKRVQKPCPLILVQAGVKTFAVALAVRVEVLRDVEDDEFLVRSSECVDLVDDDLTK